jgi:threonine/homoserine/homoserine lactone efflux protein
MVWSAVKRPAEGNTVSPVELRSAVPARGLLRQGLVTNLLNPKAGAFFTAVFPQFVSAH